MTTNTNALSVEEFCNAYGISTSFFYKLMKQGKAPTTMQLGARRLISSEAAEQWRKQMETPTKGGV